MSFLYNRVVAIAEKLKQKTRDASLLSFTRAIDKAYGSWGYLISRSFVSGIFIGLGATIGFAIVVALIGYILEVLGVMPVVGDFFKALSQFVHSAVPG